MQFPAQNMQIDEKIYTDWFPRGGDDAIFRAILVDAEMGGSPLAPLGEVTIDVFTKNADDTGDGTAVSGAQMVLGGPVATVGGVSQQLVISTSSTGLKELLRFKMVAADGWITPMLLPPVFFDSGRVA